MVRHAHHERLDFSAVRPELVEGRTHLRKLSTWRYRSDNRVAFVMKEDVAPNPVNATLASAVRIMFEPYSVTDLV